MRVRVYIESVLKITQAHTCLIVSSRASSAQITKEENITKAYVRGACGRMSFFSSERIIQKKGYTNFQIIEA